MAAVDPRTTSSRAPKNINNACPFFFMPFSFFIFLGLLSQPCLFYKFYSIVKQHPFDDFFKKSLLRHPK
jgi:hypothetical protein